MVAFLPPPFSPYLCAPTGSKHERHLLCSWIICDAGPRQLATFPSGHRGEIQVFNL